MVKVEIYTTEFCPYCLRAKELLNMKGVDYKEYRVDGDDYARHKMTERAGGKHTVPQIFIDGKHVGGCDDLYDLDSKGQLDGLLRGQNGHKKGKNGPDPA